jgi:DNA processing protein
MSKGPYALIQKGAKLVTCAKDIISELGISNSQFPISNKSKIPNRKGDTEEEDLILKLLENEPLHFDELVRRTKFNSPKLSSVLSLMEIKSLIKSLNSGHFSVVA